MVPSLHIKFVTPPNQVTNQSLQPALLTEDVPTLHRYQWTGVDILPEEMMPTR